MENFDGLQAIVEALIQAENPGGVFLLVIPPKNVSDENDDSEFVDSTSGGGMSPSSGNSGIALQMEANSASAPISGLGNAP